ncbi:sensor histidine kinase [Occallatibacter riparius]|uniref:histidine kinase n=1 Tax=Occallatibacter riparius TaxID=1002689 RepID=A0A9J7BS92_9BACT|nr:HAMP domain-containing sensor histidine kinase [Occallatibacter riparius]UWZ85455.1 HAMP domain-containing histidine kinase [Occallatibacter riparius]
MSPSLMPHAVCWSQDQNLIWTMVISNGITFLSYFTICLTLFYLARKTGRVVARDWAFFLVGFAIFIVACGSTHLMEVVTTWIPVFWIDAWTNIITAVFSAYVAFEFTRKAPGLVVGINDYADRLSNTETERARMEQSLVAARKLDEWNKMAAVVSHEINNPLAAIGNLLFLMQLNPDLPEGVNGIVQQATDEVKRIEALTRSTLGFFRTAKDPEPVDLASSAEAVRFLLGPTLRQRSVEMVIQAHGDCTVSAYAVETRQVLLNLVRNAVEATTKKGAKVTVELEGRPDDVRIEVVDEGGGIAPAIKDTLFQFGVSTKGEGGNGMGLWLVKQLVTKHGGTIDVDSASGQGARFTLIWPRRIPENPSNEEQVTARAGQ